MFFKTENDAKADLSAPASHELTLSKTEIEEKPYPDVYSADNPISVTLPIYDQNPDLLLVVYPGLRQGINKNAVRVFLVSSPGYTVALPAQYEKGSNGQHQFTVSKNAIEEHGAVISASPRGIDYSVFVEFDGEQVPVKSRLKIKA